MFLLQTPTSTPDWLTSLLQQIFANGEKIGVGFMGAAVILVTLMLLRYLSDSNRNNTDLNKQLINLATDNNEGGKSMADAANSMRDGAQAIRESALEIANASKGLVEQLKQLNLDLASSLTNGFTKIVPEIKEAVHNEFDAYNIRAVERDAALLSELKKYFSQYSSQRTGLFLLDSSCNILHVSQNTLNIFESDIDDVVGKGVHVLFDRVSLTHPDGTKIVDSGFPCSPAIDLKQPHKLICGFRSKISNANVWLEMSADPQLDSTGEVTRVVMYVRELGTIMMEFPE